MAYLNSSFLFFALLVALASSFVAHAGQSSSNRQDFCVATDDPSGRLRVDGRFCKNPANVTENDFVINVNNGRIFTNNQLRIKGTVVRVDELPGLNTLGISFAKYDVEPNGINPIHSHPRATELFIVMTGIFYCGFVSSSLSQGVIQNRLFAKVLYPGDIMVFPKGLPHFQYNVGGTSGLIFAGFNSEDFGRIEIAQAVFGAQPSIMPKVIADSFQLSTPIVQALQNNFTGRGPI